MGAGTVHELTSPPRGWGRNARRQPLRRRGRPSRRWRWQPGCAQSSRRSEGKQGGSQRRRTSSPSRWPQYGRSSPTVVGGYSGAAAQLGLRTHVLRDAATRLSGKARQPVPSNAAKQVQCEQRPLQREAGGQDVLRRACGGWPASDEPRTAARGWKRTREHCATEAPTRMTVTATPTSGQKGSTFRHTLGTVMLAATPRMTGTSTTCDAALEPAAPGSGRERREAGVFAAECPPGWCSTQCRWGRPAPRSQAPPSR